MKTIVKMLSVLLMVSILVCGCSRTENNNGNVSGASDRLADSDIVITDEKTVTTITDYEAEGVFSEGLAFVTYSRDGIEKYAYIDKMGKVSCELPDGYTYGLPFHNGLAVVIKEIKCGSMGSMSGFAVIDNRGNIVIDGSEYAMMSRASEGIICAFKIDKTYAGTTYLTEFLNYQGEIVARVNDIPDILKGSSLLINSYTDIKKYERYFQFGTVPINGIYYNSKGNVVKELNDDIQTEDNLQYVLFRGWYYAKMYDRKNLTKITNEDYKYVNTTFGDEGMVSPDGITFAQRNDDDGYYIEFITPNGEFKKHSIEGLVGEFSPIYVRDADSDCWIVHLENSYTALIDVDGKFCFEPIQEENIEYLGEGKYYLMKSQKVIDSSGKELFTFPGMYSSPSGGRYVCYEFMFHEGMLKYDGHYITETGDMINCIYY